MHARLDWVSMPAHCVHERRKPLLCIAAKYGRLLGSFLISSISLRRQQEMVNDSCKSMRPEDKQLHDVVNTAVVPGLCDMLRNMHGTDGLAKVKCRRTATVQGATPQ